MGGPWSTTDFSEIKKETLQRPRHVYLLSKKASLRHASSGPLSYSQSLEKSERYLCAKTDFNIQASWRELGVRREWKRRREEIDLSKSKMLSVYLCGVFPGLGEKMWKLEHSLIPSYKKNLANSAHFHTIHSITPLIIHICSENKNTNDQMSFLSGGCYTCEEMLMGGLRLHRCSCVKPGLSEREQKKLWISLTLGFMGPWPPLFLSLCI